MHRDLRHGDRVANEDYIGPITRFTKRIGRLPSTLGGMFACGNFAIFFFCDGCSRRTRINRYGERRVSTGRGHGSRDKSVGAAGKEGNVPPAARFSRRAVFRANYGANFRLSDLLNRNFRLKLSKSQFLTLRVKRRYKK